MDLSNDIRFAARGLRRSKGFAAVAVLTLAVGIAGTTTMFALVDGILLRPLPVRDQERVVVIWKENPASAETRWPFHASEIPVLRESSRVLEAVAGVGYQENPEQVVVENGARSYLNLKRVTGDFFDVLGVRPILGRALTRADDVIGSEHVLVITHGLWQRRYGGSPDVIGRGLILNDQPFTIVGVMPPDVEYPRGVEAWVTVSGLASTVADPTFRGATLTELVIVARLRSEVTLAQAATELRALTPELDGVASPDTPQGLGPSLPIVRSFEETLVGDVRGGLLVLFATVALVLLIASANVANLLLMRGEGRREELAIRAALGASRGRLVRQTLTESALLAVAATVVALLVTWWMLPVLVALVPDGLPRVESVRIDPRVVLFAFILASMAAALAGTAPALLPSGANLAWHLRGGGRGATGRAARHGRRALVVAQVALAILVVAAAGLLTRSVVRLHSVGTELADRLVLVPLDLPPEKYAGRDRRLQFLTAAIEQLESSPAISAATPVNAVPFTDVGWLVPVFTAEGQSLEQVPTNPSLNLEAIHPNYFETFEMPIVRGRPFIDSDTENATPVAIVSEDVAARTWPGQSPIGKRLKMGTLDSQAPWLTVVGVTQPTRYRELTEARATIYVPAEQLIVTAGAFALRTTASPDALASLVQERVRAIDPDVSVSRVAPFRELLERPLARPRFNASLIGIFGAAALFLTAVGLYAVMAAFVRMRQREIGVRMALGANAHNVRALVLWEGLQLAGLGAAIGLAAALAGNRAIAGLLFEVSPLDPASMLGAAATLVGASALACYLPARRATRVDPVAVLRAE